MPLPPPTTLTLPPKGKTAYYGEDDDIVYRLLDGEKPQAFSAVTLDWKP